MRHRHTSNDGCRCDRNPGESRPDDSPHHLLRVTLWLNTYWRFAERIRIGSACGAARSALAVDVLDEAVFDPLGSV
jgi:hypothetical protein